jgi:hypothetical protein
MVAVWNEMLVINTVAARADFLRAMSHVPSIPLAAKSSLLADEIDVREGLARLLSDMKDALKQKRS